MTNLNSSSQTLSALQQQLLEEEADAADEMDEEEYERQLQYDRTDGRAMAEAMTNLDELAGQSPTTGRRRGRPPATHGRQQRTRPRPRRIQASTTIVTEQRDLPDHIWELTCDFLEKQSETDPSFKAFFALERGGQEGHLHVQGVIDMISTSTVKMHMDMKTHLKNDDGTLPDGFKMCVKELTGKNVHTWHGMLGYCQKDHLLSHYAFHLVGNITDEDLLEGRNRYMIYGAGSIKNRGSLKPDNLLSKMSLWWTTMCGADMSIDAISVLQQMLQSGLYFPTMTWIQPVGGYGLDQTRLEVLFKVMKDWKVTTRSDVRTIFMRPDHRYNDVHLELAGGAQPHDVMLRDWQQALMQKLTLEPSDRTVMWYHEAVGNTGKSFFARYLANHHSAVQVGMMKRDDMLHVLAHRITDQTKIVVFDITRTIAVENPLMIYEVLEMLKDGQISSGKYESTVRTIQPVHVLVFSNSAPRVEAMSLDRWDIVEIGVSDAGAETIHAAGTRARVVGSLAANTVPATSVDVEHNRVEEGVPDAPSTPARRRRRR